MGRGCNIIDISRELSAGIRSRFDTNHNNMDDVEGL